MRRRDNQSALAHPCGVDPRLPPAATCHSQATDRAWTFASSGRKAKGGSRLPTATARDEAPLQLAAVQLSHCVWGLHAWGPRGSDPTAGEVTAADPVPVLLR